MPPTITRKSPAPRRRARFRPLAEELENRTLLSAGAGVGVSQVDFGSVVPVVTQTGRISVSINGLGTTNDSGTIQVAKPAGATVRSAYLAAASNGFTNRRLADGDVKIDTVDVRWDISTPSSIFSWNHWADITALVKAKLDAAPAGLVNFTITEVGTSTIDGEILAVVFDDPAQTTNNTVALLFGAQAVAGDTFVFRPAQPLNKSDPNFVLDMSVGISFSSQSPATGQYTLIDVNGRRLTSAAGGEDDGTSGNGALLTVGGLGDTNANPDPDRGAIDGPRQDDELYNLSPFVNTGDTAVTVTTSNPSRDDNLFFAAFFLKTTAPVVTEAVVLGPVEATHEVGGQDSVTATVTDNLGRPVANRQVSFLIVNGPHAGRAGNAVTDTNGRATFTYTGTAAGNDQIEARITDGQGNPVVSNRVVRHWVAANRPPSVSAGGPYTVPEGGSVPLTALGQDLDGDAITFAWDLDNDGTFETSGQTAVFSAAGLDGPSSRTVAVRGDDGHGHAVVATATVAVTNVAPTATFTAPAVVNEGSAFTLSLTNPSDPSAADRAAGFTYAFDVGDGAGYGPFGPLGSVSVVAPDNGTRTVRGKVRDKDGGETEYTATVVVNNVAPASVSLGLSAASLTEGQSTTLTGTFTDPGVLDTHTVVIRWGDGSADTTLNLAAGVLTFSAGHAYLDDNPSGSPVDVNAVTVTVTDKDGGSGTGTAAVTVNNAAPVITSVTGPVAPLAVGTAATVTAAFTDAGVQDTHTVTFTWDDGTSTTVAGDRGVGTASHVYTAAGVYTVRVTVTDDDTGQAMSQYQFVVVFDPSAGFVTGGGQIDSPAGAYRADSAAAGRATFGFVSKYLPGQLTPRGNTRFQLHFANFTFLSDAQESLVLVGGKAQYRGTGTVNGAAGYGYVVTVYDGDRPGGDGVDRFRIKVWQTATGAVVYDNRFGASDDLDLADPPAIARGSIVVHTGGLMAAGGPDAGPPQAEGLTPEQLQPILAEAVARWQAAGVDPTTLKLLLQVDVRIGDLPKGYLGLAAPGVVWVSADAAGFGWFLDPTPAEDEEFGDAADGPAAGRMDLLTVVAHELGHVLGLEHSAAGDDLMAEALPPGVRRVPHLAKGSGEAFQVALALAPPDGRA